jgi:hypothetical protein
MFCIHTLKSEHGPLSTLTGILGENLVIPSFLTTSVSKFWGINALAFVM